MPTGGVFGGDVGDQGWTREREMRREEKTNQRGLVKLVPAAGNWDWILPGPSEAVECWSELLSVKSIDSKTFIHQLSSLVG